MKVKRKVRKLVTNKLSANHFFVAVLVIFKCFSCVSLYYAHVFLYIYNKLLTFVKIP